MKYEIDFHPVGTASKSGDAISARFTVGMHKEVVVIDGGTTQSGEEVANALWEFYQTTVIDRLVLTHPDDDHSSGLRVLMNSCTVGELWMHRPWRHAASLLPKFKDSWTVQGLERELRNRFPIVAELEEIAFQKHIPIHEPFAGANIGFFKVVSPTRDFYLDLVPNMSRTPNASDEAAMDGVKGPNEERNVASSSQGLQRARTGFESWNFETLEDSGETSASNESSVVLYCPFDSKRILLTSDAGQLALSRAADYCDWAGLPLQNFDLVSIPHHGSRRNVGPTILDRIIGPSVPQGSIERTLAIASASKDDTDHPRRSVMNAFKRRGCKTATTEGKGIMVRHNTNFRDGYYPLAEIPIYTEVEAS